MHDRKRDEEDHKTTSIYQFLYTPTSFLSIRTQYCLLSEYVQPALWPVAHFEPCILHPLYSRVLSIDMVILLLMQIVRV